MIYASTDELAEVDDRSLKLGRLVAVNQFTKALIQHGSFSEYRFYCASLAAVERTRQRLESGMSESALDRVTLTLQPNLLGDLATTPFSVLHQASGWSGISQLGALRNRFAAKSFPVTGQIHSLNETHAPLRALKVALSHPRPYDAILCSSEAGRRTMRSFFEQLGERLAGTGIQPHFPGEFAKISLGVDTERFAPQDAKACRKKLHLPENATILLHLGRISAHDKSDPSPLFYLFARLVRERPQANLRLVLAGGAEEANVAAFQETCSELGIADRVLFRPNFEDELKPVYYGAADIFFSLADSLQETFGLSVIEAMACAKPVVVSDFDGYREIVENEKSGLTVPTIWGPADGFLEGISAIVNAKIYQMFLAQSIVVDIASLRSALLRLIDEPSLRQQLGNAARQRAGTEYSWKAVIPQYEALWKELGARAQKSGDSPSGKPDPFAADFFRSFSHFPSKLVTPAWTARLTEFGKQSISGAGLPAMYSYVGILLSETWLKLLLQQLAAGPCSVGELLLLAEEQLGAPREHTLYHLLWLAKYDVIALAEG